MWRLQTLDKNNGKNCISLIILGHHKESKQNVWSILEHVTWADLTSLSRSQSEGNLWKNVAAAGTAGIFRPGIWGEGEGTPRKLLGIFLLLFWTTTPKITLALIFAITPKIGSADFTTEYTHSLEKVIAKAQHVYRQAITAPCGYNASMQLVINRSVYTFTLMLINVTGKELKICKQYIS